MISEKIFTDSLRRLSREQDKDIIISELTKIKHELAENIDAEDGYTGSLNGTELKIPASYLINEIDQILGTRTLERIHYYTERLIKSISENKTSEFSDINLSAWKMYPDILTDSLWIIEKRERSGSHKGDYWGNFIPQIPNQLFRRFTKPGEWIIDPFAGSGTSLIEARRLGRNIIGVDLQKGAVEMISKRINSDPAPPGTPVTETVALQGNSRSFNFGRALNERGADSASFIIYHPPYWDIIKFSDDTDDLSNAGSVEAFLEQFSETADNTLRHLAPDRFCAVVIGDKYKSGEWIPLGFKVMDMMMNKGLKLKSIIVKNFDETKAKMKQKQLWRYRALAGGFYIFKHEYIFLFQKD